MRLHTAVVSLAFAPPSAEMLALATSAFSGEERKEVEALRAGSVAGRIALKRAVALLGERLLGNPPPLAAVRVSKAPDGRPLVRVDGAAETRAADVYRRMRVSISHSRTTAVGAAAVDEEGA